MEAKILSLIPNNCLAVGNEDLAEKLDRCAARVRAGEFPDLERVIVIYDTPTRIYPNTYGRQCNKAELVGLLHYAIDATINPAQD
jgi:hypothetical protein